MRIHKWRNIYDISIGENVASFDTLSLSRNIVGPIIDDDKRSSSFLTLLSDHDSCLKSQATSNALRNDAVANEIGMHVLNELLKHGSMSHSP